MSASALEKLGSLYPTERTAAGTSEVEYVRTRGGGVPVLMLPGAQGTCEIFCHQLLRWGATRTVVSLTYPGSPQSDVLVDSLDRFADALALETFDLVGSSLGGYVAQRYAARRPERVRRLVIGNSFHDPSASQSAERRAALEAKSAQAVKEETMEKLRAQPEGPLREALLELVGRRQDAGCLKSRFLAVQMASPVPPLDIPVERILLVASDNDPLVSPAMWQSMRTRYAGAREAVIAGGGHYPYLVQPESYNSAVGPFLGM